MEYLIDTSTPYQAASTVNTGTPTYYAATRKRELSSPSLETDLGIDVVVTGGGFPDTNTTLELAEHSIIDIVVLGARHLGFGGTGHNDGQIMAGIGHDLEKICKDVSEDDLRTIFEINDLGTDVTKGRTEKYTIDINFCHGYGHMDFSARQAKTLQAQEKELRSFGSPREIRYLYDAKVRQIIGSDAYSSALLHMGGDHVHPLDLLLGEVKALAGPGARILEYSPALEVQHDERIRVRTAKGSITASKLFRAYGSFSNRLEPGLCRITTNTYAFQMIAEPLPDELIQRISPIRGAYSDIYPVIGCYRVTDENRLLFGAATSFVERIPGDPKAWNRKLVLRIFPYLRHVRTDLTWDGSMACGANLFPQIGSLSGWPDTLFVQGYPGFGVVLSHIIRKVLAKSMSEDPACYDLFSSVRCIPIYGKGHFRPLLLSAGKTWHQLSGYQNGRY